MRGKVSAHRRTVHSEGITPAYAGKSVLLVFQSAVNRDHPRICGEKLPRTLRPSPRKGSPPHMRGKVNEKKANGFDIRITPAYAGKSTLLCFPAEPGWDHPRICGEKSLSGTDTGRKEGSPPHMRGKVASFTYTDVSSGDHPRICGEKLGGPIRFPAFVGSPPHMRGKAAAELRHGCRRGDHPRICGEKWAAISSAFCWMGSPPHMRGKVKSRVKIAHFLRITPAYAGKSRITYSG